MEINELFSKYGYPLDEEKIDKFNKYFEFLIEENKKFNLTAITEKNDVLIKHFLDSILAEKNIFENSKIIDIGSGAGFPALPLKIVRDDLNITMVDSLNKRVNFLNQTIELLELKNITAVHARAEDYIKNNREMFDFAVARAVAPLKTLLEYLVPYLKVGGKCLIYKSVQLEEEIKQAKNALNVLNCKVVKIENYKIDEIDADRKILVIEKLGKTNPKYPRGKNLPKLNPLWFLTYFIMFFASFLCFF